MKKLFICILLILFISQFKSKDAHTYDCFTDKNCSLCKTIKIKIPSVQIPGNFSIVDKTVCLQCKKGLITNPYGFCVDCPRIGCSECSSSYFDNIDFKNPLTLPTPEKIKIW